MSDEPEVLAEDQVQPAAADEPAIASAADQFDAMDDEALRAFIKARDGRSPHSATGREKLLKSARGDGAISAEIEAAEPDETQPVQAEAEVEVVDEPAPPAETQPLDQDEAEASVEGLPARNPAAASAALDAVELRVAELIAYLRGELHHFEDGVDGVCRLIGERLKAAL